MKAHPPALQPVIIFRVKTHRDVEVIPFHPDKSCANENL
jgi:hypothetical protein